MPRGGARSRSRERDPIPSMNYTRNPGTIATASVVASSTIVRDFSTRPAAVRSTTKSADHTSLMPCGR